MLRVSLPGRGGKAERHTQCAEGGNDGGSRLECGERIFPDRFAQNTGLRLPKAEEEVTPRFWEERRVDGNSLRGILKKKEGKVLIGTGPRSGRSKKRDPQADEW